MSLSFEFVQISPKMHQLYHIEGDQVLGVWYADKHEYDLEK